MTTPEKNKTELLPPVTVQNFPIVGIGASAGGLDAFKSLIKAIPEDSGMAYVLVQHLDPAHESILPEILQRVTKIPVLEITDDIHLAPDHIYVIPSNKMLVSFDGVLKLADRAKKINLTIDVFFTSLAEVHKEFAVGVVLSGTGTDGTLGLKAIKEHGGISIAQDSVTAAYDSMPQSAINAGVVDFILAPEEIPEQLLHINSTFRSTHVFKEEEEGLPKNDEAIFKQILSLLRQRSGVDFTYYKQPTFHRRIARRIAITKKKNLAGYLKFFRINKEEQDALFHDVLIPVTSFFRDPKTFQSLSATIFPALFKNKPKDEPIRIWIAGCSTGEEAYSIAISLHEYLALSKREGTKIQIFASDISDTAIKSARHGMFAKAEVEKLSPERIKNYFTKNNGGYEVNKHIRDLCVFAPHNFLKDPPFAKMDIISCRNVLIYMDAFLQKKALTTFHYALKENGFLILGKSESTSNVSEMFAAVNPHEKIYLRKSLPGRFMHVATERKEEALSMKSQNVTKQEAAQTDFRKSAEQMLLAKFTPASVVVNEQMDIVHIHGTIAPFLEAPQGKPTFNLLKMAHQGLAFELRNALHKAKLREVAVVKENIPIKFNGKNSLVTIQIVPLTDTVDIHYLVLFAKTTEPDSEENPPVGKAGNATSSSRKMEDMQKQNERLEKELAHTREDMRSVTEDMEATNEELQSANEELQSSNEEMQSLNEEMETSKEELQSTNEELTIVNQELMDKQEQLNAARLYSEAIVTTIREPLVVLDRSLRIKTANASFYKKFNIAEEEIEDKLFYEIQSSQWDDHLMRSMLDNILSKKETIIDFELIMKFPALGERHLLLNARQIKNEKTTEHLILLAIDDETEKIAARNKIEANALLTQEIYMNAPASICTFKGLQHTYELVNPAYQKLFKNRELVGKTLLEALPELEGQGVDKILDNVYKTGEVFRNTEIPVMLAIADDGEPEQRYFNSTMQPIYNNANKIIGVTNFGYDVTEQIMARKLMEASEKRFSNILAQSLMAIAILKGPEMIVTFANDTIIAIWGKGTDVFGKRLDEVLPEIKSQVFPELLNNVYTTGVHFVSNEIKCVINRNGKLEECYFNLVYQPYRDVDDSITGITILATEVTETVNARKRNEEIELFNRTILESSPDCLKVLDAEGRIQYMNSNALCQMEIDDFSAVKDENWWTFWGSKNEALVKSSVDKALKGETAYFTALCPVAKGTPKWWDVVVSPVSKLGEPVQQIIAVSRDITEKKNSEEALSKSKEQLQLGITVAGIALAEIDYNTGIITLSAEAAKLYDLPVDVLTVTRAQLHDTFHPDDTLRLMELISQSFNPDGNRVIEAEHRIVLASKEVRWLKINKKIFFDRSNNPPKPLYGILASQDITLKKQSEEKIKASEAKFRTLSQTLPVMVWTAAPDGKKNFFNQYFLDYTGLSFEELQSDGMLQIIFPDDLKNDLQMWQHSLKTGEDFKIEKRLRHHDGSYRWHVSHGIAQKDNHGNITGWIGSSADIHQHKTREQQKDEFISIASHEMKTPLTTAKGYIELLLMSLNEENSTALYATKANQAVERLNELVTELLDSSKIQNGQLNYTNSTFDFNELVEETVENFQLGAKNHRLQKVGNCLKQITADRGRLQQVLINLLSNAIKYSPKADKLLVTIEKQTDTIQVSVQDFGVGMSVKHLDKVFDRYYRVEEHAVHFQGLGIGLYISKNIVERHGGKMWVESEPGKGSTFYFTLPLYIID